MKKVLGTIALIAIVLLPMGGCASGPSFPPLSQPEMRHDDPRMPPDLFSSRTGQLMSYWMGSLAPSSNLNQVSVFRYGRFIRNLRFNEVQLISGVGHPMPGFMHNIFDYHIFLPPGISSLDFIYNRNYQDPGAGLEMHIREEISWVENFRPATEYSVALTANQIRGSRRYDLRFNLQEHALRNYRASVRGSLHNRIYLVPYDETIPFNSQSFLETLDGVYIISFNGETVSWGSPLGKSMTIGVPSGNSEIIVKNPGNGNIRTLRTELIPGYRYVFFPPGFFVCVTNPRHAYNQSEWDGGRVGL